MNGFRQRRKTTNLPNTTITMLDKLKPRRVREVSKYCYISDDTDQPFTIQELHMVLKTGKDTAPGADDSMVHQAGAEGHQAIPVLLNHSLVEGVLPRSWKESVMVPNAHP